MPTEDFFIGGGQPSSPTLELGVMLQGLGFPLRIVNDLLSTASPTANPVSVFNPYVASSGEFLTVTCTDADIPITLPDPTLLLNKGHSIFIHKEDLTDYRVTFPATDVPDIAFTGTTMHLLSNGIEWVIS